MPSDEEFEFESTHDEPPRSDREAYAQRRSEKQGGMGCVFYGCLGLIALFFLAIFGCFFAMRIGAQKMLANVTTDHPMEIGSVEYSGKQMQELRDRIEEYEAAIEMGVGSPELVLSGDDLNALIADDEDLGELSEYVYVSIEEDEIGGDVSVPLEEAGRAFPPLRFFAGKKFLKDRHFNGSATFDAALEDGILTVMVTSIETDGEDIPENVMDQIRSENFAERAMNEPEFRELLRKIESFEISDGMVRIVGISESSEAETESIDSLSTDTEVIAPIEADSETSVTATDSESP